MNRSYLKGQGVVLTVGVKGQRLGLWLGVEIGVTQYLTLIIQVKFFIFRHFLNYCNTMHSDKFIFFGLYF